MSLTIPNESQIIKQSIGDYRKEIDFQFQEEVRSLDVAIHEIVKSKFGKDIATRFSAYGAGIMIATTYLLEKKKFSISKKFETTIDQNLTPIDKFYKPSLNSFFNNNVCGEATKIITHHTLSIGGWDLVNSPETIDSLNALIKLKHIQAKFTFNGDVRIYLELSPEFFDQLWKTDFPSFLEKNGYQLSRNKECPHITLVGAAGISKLRKEFKMRKPEEFNNFIVSLLEELNKHLEQSENPIEFTELQSKYCENYSFFKEIIVAKVKSKLIEDCMTKLKDRVFAECKLDIPHTKSGDYHVTIATNSRAAQDLSKEVGTDSTDPLNTVEALVNGTGKYKDKLSACWQAFVKNHTQNV